MCQAKFGVEKYRKPRTGRTYRKVPTLTRIHSAEGVASYKTGDANNPVSVKVSEEEFKKQIQARLTDKGIKFNKRFGMDKLKKLLLDSEGSKVNA